MDETGEVGRQDQLECDQGEEWSAKGGPGPYHRSHQRGDLCFLVGEQHASWLSFPIWAKEYPEVGQPAQQSQQTLPCWKS